MPSPLARVKTTEAVPPFAEPGKVSVPSSTGQNEEAVEAAKEKATWFPSPLARVKTPRSDQPIMAFRGVSVPSCTGQNKRLDLGMGLPSSFPSPLARVKTTNVWRPWGWGIAFPSPLARVKTRQKSPVHWSACGVSVPSCTGQNDVLVVALERLPMSFRPLLHGSKLLPR